jgi:hypothetical protein
MVSGRLKSRGLIHGRHTEDAEKTAFEVLCALRVSAVNSLLSISKGIVGQIDGAVFEFRSDRRKNTSVKGQ